LKILVTGALGHIGSHLVRALPQYLPGIKIIMVDNLMTQRYCSLFNLPVNYRYQFIDGDIRQLDLNEIFDGVDVVVHLAAITDAAGSFNKAKELEDNNLSSTDLVAKVCASKKIRLLALSSTSVYGTQNNIVSENCLFSELKPQSPYAETKLNEEALLKTYSIKSGLRMVCCRFGTIFGVSPGIRFHTAVNKFCWQAALGQEITVWTTAYEQKRPYLDVIDAGRAIAHIIEKDLFYSEIYNILTSNSTVKEVVDSISMFEPNVKVRFVDSPIMNQLSYEVSRAKFENTGFQFIGNMNNAIKKTLDLLKGLH
jgi:UDP-glucose 4-epimerase